MKTVAKPGDLPLVRPEPIMKATGLAWLHFEKPNLARQAAFLRSFGFRVDVDGGNVLFARGAGSDGFCYKATLAKRARFVGAAFTAANRHDLEALSLVTGRPIETAEDPGGGERIRLVDPNGFTVDVVYGRQPSRPAPTRDAPYAPNTPFNISRINQPLRPPLQAAQVIRLGHYVLGTPKFAETAQWYMRHLGLIPSDVGCIDTGEPLVAFMRLDLGENPADHHSLVVATGPLPHYDHSAYEVIDIDAIGQGQQVLKRDGYRHVWGIGRHRLGSQLFDYWKDPDGHMLEHYADGDLFTADYPTNYSAFDPGTVWTWGDDLPKNFGVEKSPKVVIAMLRQLATGQLSRQKLSSMLRAISAKPRPWL
ncbi:hypothetical protein D3874_21950 [Oleomonas cavernae]|uniref:VOC domain-containing protein n=1 Tax=Oleomonas cavernae TaxID=2320859 RepID=A0A418WH07_9PROT|nr:VOC family protein [Oleomonas cavernae]RJF89305.1 hypothetical protein D3874_21950 [Oleomonas cavernae]